MSGPGPGPGQRGVEPTVTLFCGLPGSGKSTLARRLETAGRGVRLCTDEWQAALGIDHAEEDQHERLQTVLYRHGLRLLRSGVDVIVEDGLWRADERAAKFADAREVGARIELHVFEVPFEVLWSRLQQRNVAADPTAYPMTRDQLQSAWDLFERPSPAELAAPARVFTHSGGLD